MNLIDLTISFLKLIQENTTQIDQIILVDNGSDDDILPAMHKSGLDSELINKIQIIRNKVNVGVRDALNQIWLATDCDYICYTHNDVEFLEKGWDVKIRDTFNNIPEAGIVGCYGAKGLGNSNIYTAPYEQNQLARQIPVSNAVMDKNVHGFRKLENEYENVAVFDGFMFVCKKELLDKIGGMASWLEVHHQYDNYLCIESLVNGYENIVIKLGLNHLGGRSDVSQNWSDVVGKSKQQVHTDSHPSLYAYGKGKLPIMIEDIYSEDNKICGYNLWMDRKLVKTRIYE